MTLEQPDVIDITHIQPDGRVLLILTDAGCTPDPSERFVAHAAKLTNYVRFVCSPLFDEKFPGKTWRDVSIIALCKNPPTPDMLKIVRIGCSSIAPEAEIPVEFRVFDPESEPEAPPSRPAPPVSPSTVSLQTSIPDPGNVEVIRVTPADRQLVEAVMRRDAVAVRAALADGADPMQKLPDGVTALVAACVVGDPSIFTMLLDASPNLIPADARALWVLAKATSHNEVARILEQWGALPTLMDKLRWRFQKRQLRGSPSVRNSESASRTPF